MDETFEIIQRAHIATDHGGRDKMITELRKKYANITQLYRLDGWLKICPVSKKFSFHSGLQRSPYNALFGCEPRTGLRSLKLPDEVLERLISEQDLLNIFQANPENESPSSSSDAAGQSSSPDAAGQTSILVSDPSGVSTVAIDQLQASIQSHRKTARVGLTKKWNE